MGLATRCSEAIRGHAAAELSSMVTVFLFAGLHLCAHYGKSWSSIVASNGR